MFEKLIEKLYLKQYHNLAYYDQLCSCYNRNYYELELKKEENRNLINNKNIIVIDINGFKNLNDKFGHHNGDIALKRLIEGISQFLVDEDYIVRYGGDEFIIFSKMDDSDLESLNLKLSNNYNMTISYGVTTLIEGEKLDIAVERADSLMYTMKKEYYEKLKAED